MDYNIKEFITEHLPKGKEQFSRDAVELLITLAWKAAKESERQAEKDRKREKTHGPDWI